MEKNPYAVPVTTFEQTVAVPVSERREMVGQPPESTPLSGDEAAVLRWSGGGANGPGSGVGGDGDADC